MRSFVLLVALISTLAFVPDASAKPENQLRDELANAAKSAFARADFKELDKQTSQYRISKSRSSSGLWLLTFYYTKLGYVYSSERRDGESADVAYTNFEKKTAQWAAASPESPAAHIVHATALINHAWAHRGGAYAHKVDPKAWAPFHDYIARARRYLEAHKKIAAVDPRWYELMLGIAKAQNWDRPEFDRLLTEALDREPQFYQTYFSALEYLLPKWHGNVAEIEKFAQSAVGRTAKTDGRGLYARIYWYASQSHFDNRLFEDSLIDWPRMRDGFEDVIKRYPDAWNLNNYAKFACLAQDKPKARELLKRIGSNIVPEAWSPETLHLSCTEWAIPTRVAGL